MKRFGEFQLDVGQECLWSRQRPPVLNAKGLSPSSIVLVENAGQIVSQGRADESGVARTSTSVKKT
jgi:hypothetical protein